MKKTAGKNRKQPSWKRISSRRRAKPRTFSADMAGMRAFFTVADEGSHEAVATYIEAHALLARSEKEARETGQPTLGEALDILQDATSASDAVLHAIVILGHAPTPLALEALERHARSDRVHADVAAVAADECMSWIAGCPDDQLGFADWMGPLSTMLSDDDLRVTVERLIWLAQRFGWRGPQGFAYR